METVKAGTFSFGEYVLDTSRRRLSRSGEPVTLYPKAFDLLVHLIENRGSVLTKDDLFEHVWPGQFVEENNLTVHVAALRKALGERKNEHRFIVTVPGRGYRFVGELRDSAPTEIIVETHRFERIVIEEEIESEAIEPQSRRPPGGRDASKTNLWPAFVFSSAAVILIASLGVWFWRGAAESADKQLKVTKLTASGRVTNATITPDGKYAVIAQTEVAGESLWLRQIETGSQTQVLPAQAVNFVGLTVAPDGNLIYATVFLGNTADPQIWRVPLLGGVAEVLPKEIWTGAAVSFSPDGKQFAYTESHSTLKENHLKLADVNGLNRKILLRAADDKRSLPTFGTSPVAWSPDGAEIACIVEEKTNQTSVEAGIILVNPTDGSERYLTDRRWGFITHLAWIDAENLALVAYKDVGPQQQIFSISRQTGAVRQVAGDLNGYDWLAAANGKLLTVQRNALSRLTIADFDLKSDQLNPRVILKESGSIDNIAWAAEGSILYSSSASGRRELWLVDTDGKNARQLTINANAAFGLSVSPTNGAIVFGATENNRIFLKIADPDGTNIRPLTDFGEDVYPNWTADGSSVIFQRGLNNKLVTLWRISTNDRNLVQLTETHGSHPAVSPDGTQTAFYFMDHETDGQWRVGLISNADGTAIGKLTFPIPITERRMRWHPNGDFLSQIFYKGEDINLLLLSISGGEPKIFNNIGKGDVNWFEWSRDGKQVAVSHSTETHDVVLLEDF